MSICSVSMLHYRGDILSNSTRAQRQFILTSHRQSQIFTLPGSRLPIGVGWVFKFLGLACRWRPTLGYATTSEVVSKANSEFEGYHPVAPRTSTYLLKINPYHPLQFLQFDGINLAHHCKLVLTALSILHDGTNGQLTELKVRFGH